MRSRVSSWWYDLQDSLWFIPSILTATAFALALLTLRLDEYVFPDLQGTQEWLFGAGPSGARSVLSAIAGSVMTVTGTVFSITIVALQLASSQLTPRVLRSFTGDRGIQLVLGVFIATFVYALVVLRRVRESVADGQEPFVPSISVTVAIVLALVSIGCLIYFVHHVARSIQAAIVIDRAATSTLDLIGELYPADVGRPAHPSPPEPWHPPVAGALVLARRGGYLQAVAADPLFDLAEEHRLTLRLERRIGEFVLPGSALVSLWPPAVLTPELENKIQEGLVLGPERTLQSDVELGIRQISDIALKALSPGINDPTTATICVDRLAEALVCVANRAKPSEARTGQDGRVRLVLQGPPFAELVETAYAQIRHYGAGDATVMRHLATTLGRVAALVPPERREPLARQARLTAECARDQIAIAADREQVEQAAAWATEATDRPSSVAAEALPDAPIEPQSRAVDGRNRRRAAEERRPVGD